jgi:hypothetical protein
VALPEMRNFFSYMTVRDEAAHKPEAPAKVLRWRLRLVQPRHFRQKRLWITGNQACIR